MATGYSAIAGANFIRKKNPKSIILAVPVYSEIAYNLAKESFERIICLEIVRSIFFAVGMFYEDFGQLFDKELLAFFGEK